MSHFQTLLLHTEIRRLHMGAVKARLTFTVHGSIHKESHFTPFCFSELEKESSTVPQNCVLLKYNRFSSYTNSCIQGAELLAILSFPQCRSWLPVIQVSLQCSQRSLLTCSRLQKCSMWLSLLAQSSFEMLWDECLQNGTHN